eukprot:15447783-Alexandrium_andersonii.AAC.1
MKTVKALFRGYGTGQIHQALTCQQVAAAVDGDIRDLGVEPAPKLRKIAHLGCTDSTERNLARDFQREVSRSVSVESPATPDIYTARVHILHPLKGGAKPIDFSMLLPHEYLGLLYMHDFARFRGLFLGGTGDLEEFWGECLHEDWARVHPALSAFSDPDTCP